MYQISYSSFPFHMVIWYPNMVLAETIMNPSHPIIISHGCGFTVEAFPMLAVVRVVDLKHEETATNSTKTNLKKLAFRFSVASTYICKGKLIFPSADVFVYLGSPQ